MRSTEAVVSSSRLGGGLRTLLYPSTVLAFTSSVFGLEKEAGDRKEEEKWMRGGCLARALEERRLAHH